MNASPKSRRPVVITLLILVPLLLILGWSQVSFNLRFLQPANAQQTIILVALSTFIFVAFVIFALILLRILLKLYVERRQQLLGSHFKTRMVVAFLALSLVPVCAMFLFAYGLLNRSIDRWFGTPFDLLRRNSDEIVRQLELEEQRQALHDVAHLAFDQDLVKAVENGRPAEVEQALQQQLTDLGLEAAFCFDEKGRMLAHAGKSLPSLHDVRAAFPLIGTSDVSQEGQATRSVAAGSDLVLAAHPLQPLTSEASPGAAVTVRHLPLNVTLLAEQWRTEVKRYDALGRERKTVKLNYLLVLGLLTLLTLFAATWFALFLSKQVTVPIQALAEGTHEVSQGNLGYQVTASASGELRTLIRSFNEMTRQLQENRRALEQAGKELQRANRELEEHTHTLETILENVPTGVISLDPAGNITRVNSTVGRMLGGRDLTSVRTLPDVFAAADVEEITRMFRRARRQGLVTQQLDLNLGSRRAVVALTVSSVRTRRGTVGSVLVLEDLTDLLRAQKAAAWREVAQRLAHEIKNPLTPIQLSTERIRRLLQRAVLRGWSSELAGTLDDSAALIGREAQNLKQLVDEFSRFARFPAAQPVPSNFNEIVASALHVFDGRLDGVRVHQELSPDLPQITVDPQQMQRALVNLIDNAAEALEQSPVKDIWITTGIDPDRDVLEVVVADSGPGIAADAKEKLFLPYFSTKRRGTGLGLAIVSRIISEHNGLIRVEENRPAGTRFIIELPLEHAANAQPQEAL
jgi:PAS domain S-box-containing protein